MLHSFTSRGLSVLEDIQSFSEDDDLELKTATGKDGKGELPKDFFPTYSAMANTNGGVIALGVEELKGQPQRAGKVVGIAEPERVLQQLWNNLNNPQKVSINLLTSQRVIVKNTGGKNIIFINVPRAKKDQRPVHIGPNPYTGTYRRNYDGDYLCSKEIVERMIAEKVAPSQDSRLLANYNLNDLDVGTFKAYRNNFKAKSPDHPWNGYDDKEFLQCLGGWAKDRETESEGLTLAGLLMFGKAETIQEVVPHYFLDYQERPNAKTDSRWVDRIALDGTWSGNLYDFYRKVIQKLYSELKIPFKLSGSERVDETPIHEALREALVNTLIHADYSDHAAILIVKRPDLFGFENPGLMRIPLEDAKRGGNSDCRNRNIQKMFFMVGSSDRAGSGIPRIFKNWAEQHWYPPTLCETIDPDKTILQLKMVSLIPENALLELDERFGDRFRKLPEVQILALATTVTNGFVTHAVLKSISREHPSDISKALNSLVRDRFLTSGGSGRGTYYYYEDKPPHFHKNNTPLELSVIDDELLAFLESDSHRYSFKEFFSDTHFDFELPDNVLELPDNTLELPDNVLELSDNKNSVSDSRVALDERNLQVEYGALADVAEPARRRKRLSPILMKQIILELCLEDWRSPMQLKMLLDRNAQTIRDYISELISQGFIESKFPSGTTHPGQAYKTTQKGQETIKKKE